MASIQTEVTYSKETCVEMKLRTGIFDWPMEKYLAVHGVSQSQLKHLARSPAHLREYVDNPKPSTPDQVIGTLNHLAIFQPHLFPDSHWVRPVNYTNAKNETRKWHAGSNDCKDWIAAHEDRPIIKQADYDAIIAMRDSVFRHPAAALALAQGKAEQSLFVEDAETGLQLKCRTDWLSGNACVDLKKCQDASPNGFAKTVANYAYDLQAAVNLHICKVLGLGKEAFIFIAVEDKSPFAVGVYQLDEASIAIGHSKFRRLLSKYLECVVADSWPAYSSDILYLTLPEWAKKSEGFACWSEENPANPALEIT